MTVDLGDIHGELEDAMKKMEEDMIMAYTIAGEEAVRQQTLLHKYKNQTGNLSSSVGYSVILNGGIKSEGGFEKTVEGDNGIGIGKGYMKEIIGENPKGLVLIVVAGMDYAKYVEDMGLDVLSSAELKADQILPKLLEEL